jgi:diguanylate cyclase (GGDEF)-like protein/PAS domain S-box-containing protein
MESIASTLPDIVWSVAVPSREILYVSPAIREVFGVDREEVARRCIVWGELACAEDRPAVMAAWEAGLRTGSFHTEYRTHTRVGDERWIQTRGRAAKDALGNVIRMDGISRDVTEVRAQHRKITQLSRSGALLRGISSTINRATTRQELFRDACRIAVEEGGFGIAWIGVLDREAGRIRGMAHYGFEPGSPVDFNLPEAGSPDYQRNTAFRALLEGRPVFVNDIAAEEPCNSAREMALRAGYRSVISLPLQGGPSPEGVMFLFAAQPDYFDAEEIKLLGEFSRNIGIALTHLDRGEQLKYLAQYDVLTALPNRALFHDRISALVETARASATQAAIAVVDITRFLSVNETFGRRAADAMLREIAQRLRRAWPHSEGVARMSADSFALALPPAAEGRQAMDINATLERCLSAVLGEPFRVDGKEIRISMTAGVAVFPADGRDADELFANAEAAQRRARESGEQILFYRREMNAEVAKTLLLENKLRLAVKRQEFELYYQPKRATLGARITGLEALLRWRDPESGMVPPDGFIPILEQSGLILEVGSWAMKRALEESRGWQTQEGGPLRVAVNVSPIQLRQRDFVRIVREAVERSSVGPPLLDLEITESTIMESIDENVKKLAEVRDMGVNIAVDDFGTGYSSLGYLAKLPVNSLKIDRSFIATMTSNSHSMTLVSTIISLAHALDLKVIAEGVETEEQAELLRVLKCDELQGYLFSRPMPAGAVEAYLGLNLSKP